MPDVHWATFVGKLHHQIVSIANVNATSVLYRLAVDGRDTVQGVLTFHHNTTYCY